MLLSVIIPTCNRPDLLPQCIDLLLPEKQIGSEHISYEIIVTDDSNNTVTKEFIAEKYPWIKWVKGPQKGPAANRNNGGAFAQGSWLLFIDDDCLPDHSILASYQKTIQMHPDIQAFEGRIYVDQPKKSFMHESPMNETGGFFWSCNICVERKLFQQLKGFDEEFPFAAMEDVDFFRRIKQLTDKHLFVYEAAVLHPWRVNHNLIKTTFNRHKSQLFYIKKHPEEAARLNATSHFRYFIKNNIYLLTHAIEYGFSGFGKLLYCNFLQLYFGVITLLPKKKFSEKK